MRQDGNGQYGAVKKRRGVYGKWRDHGCSLYLDGSRFRLIFQLQSPPRFLFYWPVQGSGSRFTVVVGANGCGFCCPPPKDESETNWTVGISKFGYPLSFSPFPLPLPLFLSFFFLSLFPAAVFSPLTCCPSPTPKMSWHFPCRHPPLPFLPSLLPTLSTRCQRGLARSTVWTLKSGIWRTERTGHISRHRHWRGNGQELGIGFCHLYTCWCLWMNGRQWRLSWSSVFFAFLLHFQGWNRLVIFSVTAGCLVSMAFSSVTHAPMACLCNLFLVDKTKNNHHGYDTLLWNFYISILDMCGLLQ